MPKGYFFVELEIADLAAYEAYRTAVPDIISAHGGRILVRGGDPPPLDGALAQRRRVIVEFDSPEAVKTFYDSDTYQAVLPIRLNASNGFVCLLTGEKYVFRLSGKPLESSRNRLCAFHCSPLPTPVPSNRLNGGIMSRMIKFARPGGPEVLEFIEVEAPEPGPREVRIKVKAIGINRAD